ncbi:hypothetical protein P7K49_013114, partial [Saguinus oedipus]
GSLGQGSMVDGSGDAPEAVPSPCHTHWRVTSKATQAGAGAEEAHTGAPCGTQGHSHFAKNTAIHTSRP